MRHPSIDVFRVGCTIEENSSENSVNGWWNTSLVVSVEKWGHPHPSIDVFDVFSGWGGRLVSQTEQTRRARRNAYISENIYASAISIGYFAIFSLLSFY